TEAVIVEALERLQKGRTVVIISHRPTTLAGCSAILTIEQGRIVSDTTRALVRPTPKHAPPPPARGGRLERLLAHPAVQAWRWLGILHTEAHPAADQAELPDAGPARYRKQMRRARDLIRDHLDSPALTIDDLALLDGLLAQFDRLDEHWDRLEHAVTGLPRTL